MELLQAILIALLAAGAIGAVIWPILRPARNQAAAAPADLTLDELTAKRDAALRAVKDLEFDFQTGKVAREDYPIYEQTLKEQAIAAIQAVDDYQNHQRQADRARRTELDVALEGDIAALRRTPSQAIPDAGSNGHPAGMSSAPGPAAVPAPHFCPQCGRPAQGGDRFCAHCGAALVPAAAVG
jgi:hypothetical protein